MERRSLLKFMPVFSINRIQMALETVYKLRGQCDNKQMLCKLSDNYDSMIQDPILAGDDYFTPD